MTREPLPIDPILPQLVAALRDHTCAVLQAPTGAGKTTRVPLALVDAGLISKRLVMLEPRRLAARAAARRMALERGGRVGEEIGYHVRFDRQWGKSTSVLVVTPGVLLRMLQDDPFLEFADAVVFDEFHERGLESDLVLGIVRHVQLNIRPDLRMLVMSATLATEQVARYFGDCAVITSEGRSYPVEVVYEPKADLMSVISQWLDRINGDILVFLPGLGEIRAAARELESLARERNLVVLPLYGDLPAEQQDAVLQPQTRRKIVLATNVAETSVTVEGVTLVIDTGTARVMSYDPAVGLDRLELQPISRSSAEQRAGRAGRTRPGVCVRMWSELNHRARTEQTEPEIHRVDLAGAVLQLLVQGESDIAGFPWLERPRPAAVTQAMLLLQRLDAIEGTSLTPLGRTIARLPVHPRLGRLLVEGRRLGCEVPVAMAAALLAERDPFIRPSGGVPRGRDTFSDIQDRVEAIEQFDRGGPAETPFGVINRGAASFLFRARDQLLRTVQQEPIQVDDALPNEDWPRALVCAFPDRLARRRERGGTSGVMVGGRGVRLAPGCGVRGPELFLCLDVDASDVESWVRQASGVRREWLPEESLTTTIDVEFDVSSERLTATKRRRFLDLVVDETPSHFPEGEMATNVLLDAASRRLDRVLPPLDSAAGSFLLRVRCLNAWMPTLGLPSLDDNEIRDMLRWVCAGCRGFDDLRRADWLGVLQGRITHSQRQMIEREAPERMEVPSGSRIALTYEVGRPPILAVRIQEMFGMTETPRIAGGRVRVLLHLLAPNNRPQQVTDDLASFWANTYPQVRKELRARYPKHAWPEDPLTAQAQHKPGRRGPSR